MRTHTVPALVARAAREHPDTDAFVFPEVRQTHAELERSALEVARGLAALGVRKGDAVGTLMPNCLAFVHAWLGAAMAGALVVPVNARSAPREIAHVVRDSAMRVLLTTDVVDEYVDYIGRLAEADLSGATALEHKVVLGSRRPAGFLARDEFLARAAEVDEDTARATAADVAPDDRYIMMYTSGTTAEPRGCPLTHESVVRLGSAVAAEGFRLTPEDRMWNPLPMFHVSAQAPMIAVLDAGACFVSMTHFDAKEALDLIERERATIVYPAYPTLTSPLLHHPDYHPDTFRRVRALLTVGPPDLLASFQEKLPHTSHVSCYGSTETGGIAVMGRTDDPPAARMTCGKPFAGVELEVRDLDTGEPVGPDVVGSLHVRGFNLFVGYRNDPQKTAATIDAAGWFATGDLGSIDTEGNLTFRGRTKDMLKVGGETVGALEVEAYLATHPEIAVAAVVGVPDAKYEEVPAAFVELRPGSSLSTEDVLAYCRRGLARYKVPRHVRFLTEWPMSATKIKKFALRDRLVEELQRP